MGKANQFVSTFLTYDNVFSPEECDVIRHFGLNGLPDISENPEDIQINTKKNLMVKNQSNAWISDRITNIVNQTNETYYHFDISELADLQLWTSSGNSYSDWITDIGKGEKSTRKISIIVFLSNRNDYSGGQLSFKILDSYNIIDIPQNQGSLLLFPSYLPYKTEIISKGINYRIFTWMSGNAFI
jgi:hypothetical protein